MKRINFEILIVAAGLTTFVLFQNCSGDLKIDSSASTGVAVTQVEHPKVDFGFNDGSAPVTQYQIEPGKDYAVSFIGNPDTASEFHFSVSSTTNSANCRFTATSVLTSQTLRCAYTGSSTVSVGVVWKDGTTDINQKSLTVIASTGTPTPTPGASATPANLITFSIASGTGANGAWNAMANPVVVFVGQVLRITNNDSVVHQLHTDGAPCPHQPSTMPTGSYYDCTISSEHLNISSPILYEHNSGTGAPFYMKAIDGTDLYNNAGRANCATCHSALPGSTKLNKTAAQISAAIANVGAMQIPRLQNLSADEIKALEFALKR